MSASSTDSWILVILTVFVVLLLFYLSKKMICSINPGEAEFSSGDAISSVSPEENYYWDIRNPPNSTETQSSLASMSFPDYLVGAGERIIIPQGRARQTINSTIENPSISLITGTGNEAFVRGATAAVRQNDNNNNAADGDRNNSSEEREINSIPQPIAIIFSRERKDLLEGQLRDQLGRIVKAEHEISRLTQLLGMEEGFNLNSYLLSERGRRTCQELSLSSIENGEILVANSGRVREEMTSSAVEAIDQATSERDDRYQPSLEFPLLSPLSLDEPRQPANTTDDHFPNNIVETARVTSSPSSLRLSPGSHTSCSTSSSEISSPVDRENFATLSSTYIPVSSQRQCYQPRLNELEVVEEFSGVPFYHSHNQNFQHFLFRRGGRSGCRCNLCLAFTSAANYRHNARRMLMLQRMLLHSTRPSFSQQQENHHQEDHQNENLPPSYFHSVVRDSQSRQIHQNHHLHHSQTVPLASSTINDPHENDSHTPPPTYEECVISTHTKPVLRRHQQTENMETREVQYSSEIQNRTTSSASPVECIRITL